ncbi:MAG TPA: SDR family oxidoreductase [Candidatus Binataceae bacterium]|nr:SDR family oxidoreductase [Candidatus Binataceae bacterium]
MTKRANSRSAPERGYFRGRTVLVTGASSGIGRDVALTMARMGARTALLARRARVIDQLAQEIRAGGGEALALSADVTERACVFDAIRRVLARFGRIDIVVNSAGLLHAGPIEKLDPSELERMMAVNLYGTLHTIHAVLPAMRRAGEGTIVNIGSLAGRRGVPPLGGYAATKFALVGLTEALRVELFGSGIRVALVMPGVVDTPMTRAAIGSEHFGGIPAAMRSLPVQWVTWAVLAAIALGLNEVDVPPGAAIAEKVAALFPALTDTLLALGGRFADWMTGRH